MDQIELIIGALAVGGVVLLFMLRLFDRLRGKSPPWVEVFPPLIKAVLLGERDDVMRFLEAGDCGHELDELGRSALHHAVLKDQTDIAKLLLRAGLDINGKDHNGDTPLHLAAQEYLPHLARLLLDAGADINAADHHGNTVLSDAVYYSMGRGDVIELLLDRGADPDLPNLHGVSARQLAETIANYDVQRFMPKRR